LRASRIITIAVGLLAFVIAMTSNKLIFSMVSYAWAGLGSSFGPLILLMLTWKRVTWQGVIAGLITGFASTVIWSEISMLDAVISVRFVSWVLAFLAVWLTSLLTRKNA
jgi:sodium/proline symporter